ncbi:hypothetical protein ACFSM9_29295, partial [Microvirga arabica]
MTDPRPYPTDPEMPDELLRLEYLGYTIRLQLTPLEWMAVISQPNQRPGIVLAADREAALIADSDEAGRLFQGEAGHPFRFHSGQCSELKPDTLL